MRGAPSELDAVFRASRYVVETESGSLVITLGRPDVEVANWLSGQGFTTAALLTACNPGAVPQTGHVNAERCAALEARLRTDGFRFVPAEGAAADRSWVEPSVCVLGMGARAAGECVHRFGQLAWLQVDSCGAATLCYGPGEPEG